MCIQTTIQNKIAELTNDGEDIAIVLADILRGADPTVMTCHRLEAAKILTKYGTAQPVAKIIPFNTVNNENTPSPSTGEDRDGGESSDHPEPVLSAAEDNNNTPSPLTGEGRDGGENPPHPVRSRPTLRDIVAFPVARHIRERTNNGETLIRTLCYIMEGGHYDPDPFTGHPKPTVAPREKIAAAKELMRRAFGEYSPPRRASVEFEPDAELDPGDPVNSAIAQLVRDHTDNGVEAAELLIQVIESEPHGSEWNSSHRLIAAKELFHRAYDLNYDAVTWQDFEDYLRASEEYNEAYDIAQARRKTELSAIMKEYTDAYAAGDEEAKAAAEKKYRAYLRAERGEKEEEPEYPGYGPSDPDPTPKYPLRAPKRNRSRKNGRHTAASTTHTPKLTIPLHNRSP